MMRPLVLFLSERAEGVNCNDRHDEWRKMSAAAKQEYAQQTLEKRKRVGGASA